MFCRISFVILSGKLLFGVGYACDNEPLCLIQKGEKKGFINTRGEWVIKPVFDDVRLFVDGQATAKKGGKWGSISTRGEWVIEFQVEEVRAFSEGFAPAKKGEKCGFINTRG